MFVSLSPNEPSRERRESMVTKWVGGACKTELEYCGTITLERRLNLNLGAASNESDE